MGQIHHLNNMNYLKEYFKKFSAWSWWCLFEVLRYFKIFSYLWNVEMCFVLIVVCTMIAFAFSCKSCKPLNLCWSILLCIGSFLWVARSGRQLTIEIHKIFIWPNNTLALKQWLIFSVLNASIIWLNNGYFKQKST